MLKEPMPAGPAKGHVVHLEPMLSDYYQVRGWDADCVVTQDKLRELDLIE